MDALIILGSHLFDPKTIKTQIKTKSPLMIFMREDFALCTHFKYHKLKIVFFLSAMRQYAKELKKNGYIVHYEELTLPSNNSSYMDSLSGFIQKNKIQKLYNFEIEDKFFESQLTGALKTASVEHVVLQNPMFLTPRSLFSDYLKQNKRPFMKTFYISQRKRLKILTNANGDPAGDQWSFDEENRKPLPKSYTPPKIITKTPNATEINVIDLVHQKFKDHPGDASNLWFGTTRQEAQMWLKDFLKHRFKDFGIYEDALSNEHPFLNHSLLTPYLNSGLLTPNEIIQETLDFAKNNKIPINSCEGFIRQIIGWREFIFGIYRNFSDKQESSNYWNHKQKLSPAWYTATTGIEPLDDVIKKTQRFGYAHHIERLMIVGNLMLLLEIDPHEAHKWFMEMFIDSADWVMGPNVYGMALFSDGGIFATKPYICGSNYYKKMGPYKKGAWQEGVDGLYWSFIDKHRGFFKRNPRLSMMVKIFDKMDAQKKQKLLSDAKALKSKITL